MIVHTAVLTYEDVVVGVALDVVVDNILGHEEPWNPLVRVELAHILQAHLADRRLFGVRTIECGQIGRLPLLIELLISTLKCAIDPMLQEIRRP